MYGQTFHSGNSRAGGEPAADPNSSLVGTEKVDQWEFRPGLSTPTVPLQGMSVLNFKAEVKLGLSDGFQEDLP